MTSMKVLCPESNSRGEADLHRLRAAHSLVIVTSGMLLPPSFVSGICASAQSQSYARPKKKKINGVTIQMAQLQASFVPAF